MAKEKRSVENDVEILRASPGDAELLSILGAVTFYEACVEQDDSRNLASYIIQSFHKDAVISQLNDAAVTFSILYLAGKAVGYSTLLQNSTVACVEHENAVELKRLYLIERAYGSGLGKLLLDHTLAAARDAGFGFIWLGVWEENLRAIGFYKKHGFHRIGTLTFPYGDEVGVNYVMAREL